MGTYGELEETTFADAWVGMDSKGFVPLLWVSIGTINPHRNDMLHTTA
jgi:hypothetical protein